MSEPDNTDSQGRFEAVLAEIGPQVSKYAARRLPEDRHQAEDFVQEAAVDLFQQWQQNEMSPNEAAAMMKRSILCDITDHLRKKTRRRTDVVGVDDQVLLDHLDANPSPEQEVLALMARIDSDHRVSTLLSLLDKRQRAAIVAIYIDEVSQQQAAVDLGIGVRALQLRLHKALEKLRRHIGAATHAPNQHPNGGNQS